MRNLWIIGVFVLVLVVSLSFISAPPATGRFTIGNDPPFVAPNSFQVKDGAGAGDWDNTFPFDTHNSDTQFEFTIDDPNPDTLDVTFCIGTSPNPYTNTNCNVVNYFYNNIPPGNRDLTYDYNVDPLGSLQGVPDTITLNQGHCGAVDCSRIYYVDIISDDGEFVNVSNQNFTLINKVPDTPLNLVSEDLGTNETHIPLSNLSWTAIDQDDGSVDLWPADTLVYHVQVGILAYGDEDYLADPSAASPTSLLTNPIPWGTPGIPPSTANVSKTRVYVRIWSEDDFGVISAFYEDHFDLIDNLPWFLDVELSEDYTNLQTCTLAPAQYCWVTPLSGNYTSVSGKISFEDDDGDCSNINHDSSMILCLVDVAAPDLCDPINNADYVYSMVFNGSQGNTCNFSFEIPSGNPNGIEFFISNGTYKMYLNASSQSGMATNFPTLQGWEYGALPATLYPNSVILGDGAIGLGQWNPGTSLATLINQGNLNLNVEWEATDPRISGYTCPEVDPNCCIGHTAQCWDLTTAAVDFQIDDDNDCLAAEGAGCSQVLEGGLDAEFIPETTARISFIHSDGLNVCDVFACSNPLLNETLDTYFHIRPPIGLTPGDYETEITFTY